MQNTTLFSCKITLVACKKLAENVQVAFDHLIRNNNNKTVLFKVLCDLICISNTLAFQIFLKELKCSFSCGRYKFIKNKIES